MLHYDHDISLVESQAAMTPVQRAIYLYAADEHGPEDPDSADTPSTPTVPSTTNPL